MQHNLYFHFIYQVNESKESYIKRIYDFLKGFETEKLFLSIYHKELPSEVHLMDERPENFEECLIDLNKQPNHEDNLYDVIRYLASLEDKSNTDLPIVISFQKTFSKKAEHIKFYFDIEKRKNVKLNKEQILNELAVKIKQLYGIQYKMIDLLPLIHQVFDENAIMYGDVQSISTNKIIDFDLGHYHCTELIDDFLVGLLDDYFENTESVVFEFILRNDMFPDIPISKFVREIDDDMPF
jgi:hypothetical protein